MRWCRYNQECMIEGRKEERRMRAKWTWVTILNDLLLGDSAHPAIKRKSQIIQLHMHVHVASSPALQTHDENSLLLFLQLDRRSLEMRLTNIALLSAMKQQSLMLLVAYAMTDFALWQLVYSWCHEVTVYMTTYKELVPLWISLTCCLQKWKQETQHMFTWSTWYMELVCIN